MTLWGKTHARIVLSLVFITGLFNADLSIQIFFTVLLGVALVYFIFHFLMFPSAEYIDQMIKDRRGMDSEMHWNFYHKLSNHFMKRLWFPFAKSFLTLSEIFYASSLYRHQHDFDSEYNFSYYYKTEKVAVRPIHMSKHQRVLRVISLRHYIPFLFRRNKPIEGRLRGLYQTDFDPFQSPFREYVIDLEVPSSLYFFGFLREANYPNIQFYLSFKQAMAIRRLAEEAERKYSDVYFTFDVDLPFSLKYHRLIQAFLKYRENYFKKNEPMGDAGQAAINFAHKHLSLQRPTNISFLKFKPNPDYKRVSYRDNMNNLRKARAVEPRPRIYL